MGTGISHAVVHVHECIKFFSGVSSEVQCSSSKGTIWKSSSSSSELAEHTWALSGMQLSTELKDKHLHTGLGSVCGVLQGVVRTGLNEACSMLEAWWMWGVLHNGVGKSMVSEPLSQPSSVSDNCWLKAALSAMMKCPNSISSDFWHSMWLVDVWKNVV